MQAFWWYRKFISLTHCGRVTHICVCKLTIIGSDNGLLPGQHQTIIWTNAGILLIGPLGTKLQWNVFEIQTCSFNKLQVKMASILSRSQCVKWTAIIKCIIKLLVISYSQNCSGFWTTTRMLIWGVLVFVLWLFCKYVQFCIIIFKDAGVENKKDTDIISVLFVCIIHALYILAATKQL